MSSYELLKYFEGPYGAVLEMIACSAPFALLVVRPSLDRGTERHPKNRPLAVSFGLSGLPSDRLSAYLGHISESEQTFFGRRYHIDVKGRPHVIEDDAGS